MLLVAGAAAGGRGDTRAAAAGEGLRPRRRHEARVPWHEVGQLRRLRSSRAANTGRQRIDSFFRATLLWLDIIHFMRMQASNVGKLHSLGRPAWPTTRVWTVWLQRQAVVFPSPASGVASRRRPPCKTKLWLQPRGKAYCPPAAGPARMRVCPEASSRISQASVPSNRVEALKQQREDTPAAAVRSELAGPDSQLSEPVAPPRARGP